LLDLHSAALDLARLRSRRLSWATVLPALGASGWIADSTALADYEAPAAIRRLRLLTAADSTAARALLKEARLKAPESIDALAVLLHAYPAAEAWHRQAMAYLLGAPWVATAQGNRSPAAIVHAAWRSMRPEDADRASRIPRILSASFGQPLAVPRNGCPARSVDALVTPLNWTAEEWLRRNGTDRLLAVVRRLDGFAGPGLLVERAAESLRVMSVERRAAESSSGFLESEDAIVVDPGYVPVLALGAALHEWGHLLVDGWRFEHAVAVRDSSEIALPEISPWLNEGSAEAWTDLVLGGIVERHPIFGLSEAEKRTRLAQGDAAEPHVAGYLVVRAMLSSPEGVKAGTGRVLGRLVARDDIPSVLSDRVLGTAFPAKTAAVDYVAAIQSRRFLVPETVFTIEDFVPDIVSTTIRTGRP
jgi:hypothetical protein